MNEIKRLSDLINDIWHKASEKPKPKLDLDKFKTIFDLKIDEEK
jgi:hypothetical protein